MYHAKERSAADAGAGSAAAATTLVLLISLYKTTALSNGETGLLSGQETSAIYLVFNTNC